MKYTALQNAIFSIFSSKAWIKENIQVFPENYTGSISGTEWLRLTILADGKQEANPIKSVSGIVQIEIYTPAGLGPSRSNQIADTLDSYLAGKAIVNSSNGRTEFGSSSLSGRGQDEVNSNLTKSLYSIPFNYFGI